MTTFLNILCMENLPIYLGSLLITSIGIYKLINNRSPKYNKETKGTVVKTESKKYREILNTTGNIYSSIITVNYDLNTNESIQSEFEDTTSPSMFKEGDVVNIRYKSENPKDFIIVSKKMTILYWFFIVLGLIIFLWAYLYKK